MTWDWQRLSDVVRRLKLPAGEYTLDRVGYGLSRDRASTADRVELLVTETGWRRLKERGWQERGAGTVLRHPHERDLRARVMALEDVRHEILEVDGVPVIAVEPDPPPAARPETWRQRGDAAMIAVVLAIVIGGIGYGFTLFYPTPDSATMWQHLTFRTTEVEATVDGWSDSGTCSGTRVYDTSPRINLTLSWTEDGQERTASYTGCGASVDSPQDIWVNGEGVVASQSSPWVEHLWPALAIAIVPFAAIVMPLYERLRARRWRRRT